MKNKLFALLLAFICLLAPMGTIGAEGEGEGEFITNGSFEKIKADGSIMGWGGSGLVFGETYFMAEDSPRTGKAYAKIKTDEQHVFLSQAVTGLVPGEEYTLSFFSQVRAANGAGIAVKFEFRDLDEAGKTVSTGQLQENLPSSQGEDWKEQTMKVTATGTMATILLRFNGGGEVWFDGVSLRGKLGVGVTSKDAQVEEKEKYLKSDEQQNEKLVNGGFELVEASGAAVSWSLGTAWQLTSKEKHSGNHSVMVSTEENQVLLGQGLYNLVEGTEYKVSFWYKADEQKGNGPTVKLEFRNTDADGIATRLSEHDFQKSFKNKTLTEWQQHSFSFTAPGTTATIYFRFVGGGTAYFDDLSVIGETLLSQKPEAEKVLAQPVAGAENLIRNGAFESQEGLQAYKNWEEGFVSIDSAGYEGNGVKVQSSVSRAYPWICIPITGILEGAVYQVSSMLKAESAEGGQAAFKLEFYSDEVPASANHMSGVDFTSNVGAPKEWTRVFTTFKVPEGCKAVKVYFRLMATIGSICWDEADCYMIEEPPKFVFSTDQYFYYPDWEKGSISLTPFVNYTIESGSTVDFKITDGDAVLYEQNGIPASENVTADFYTSILTELEKPYTVSYAAKHADGSLIDTGSHEIYKMPRPTALRADGVYIKDGKPFYPVFGYHVSKSDTDYEYCKQAGINVVQHFTDTTDAATIKQQLDKLQSHGLMAFISLYNGMKPAGHKDNAKKTTAIIEACKDHPALFGYMVMDEPLGNNVDMQDMINSYVLIRSLDKVHPIYAVEGIGALEKYREVAKSLDILGIDPYPYGTTDESTTVSRRLANAREAVYGKKPVYCLNQACPLGTFDPSSNQMMHEHLQALFGGVEGIGYYDVRDSYKYKDGEYYHLWDRECWDGVIYMSDKLGDDWFGAFVTGEHPYFNGQETEEMYWRSYVIDGVLTLFVLNRGDGAKTLEIPLESFDGSVKIGAYTASADPISKKGTISGNGTFKVDMAERECAVFEITPSEAVDYSVLSVGPFRDLAGYNWARNAINTVDAKGIVNHTGPGRYSPSAQITRADFAMFLMRTLGITDAATETFSDVDSAAYYGKELATGKAVGILKGMGDNLYAPYAAISRQDLMVICARGMRIAGKLDGEGAGDLDQFSDAALVADYAKEDVAAMVAAGIVQGNADGTVNPLGNATRAEAAVIMSRILGK